MAWDPDRYLTQSDHRTRPARDLLARVPLAAPARVADLGCGPGNSTRLLAERWPQAELTGVDSSPEMLARARAEGLAAAWQEADIRSWRPAAAPDVIFSNATLQWLEGHDRLLPRLFGLLAPGGVMAIQMPRNFTAPSHALMRETAGVGPWADRLAGVLLGDSVAAPEAYYDLLAPMSPALDIWQSEYLHVLAGDDAVLNWVKGTALRPAIAALDGDTYGAFRAAYAARLRAAYPRRPDGGTLYSFRRIFIVARALAPG